MTVELQERTADLEQYRPELTGYCYRMLGSPYDADDAVQETLVKAWQSIDGFEGRSSLRSWLYRIATNVCLDQLRAGKRRALPMDLSAPVPATTPPVETHPEATWLHPIADSAVATGADPAERAVLQDSIRLAFVAALQHLPARQRAVLILREVLAWQASEVAELLDTSVASVNSALQRARATLAARDLIEDSTAVTGEQEALLAMYVRAFESYDVDGLVSLLHEEVVLSMPPFELWIQGRDELAKWFVGPGSGCRGSRLLPVRGNGLPGFGSYRPDPTGGHSPWGIQLLEFRDGLIAAQHSFIDPALFPEFGLPTHLALGEVWPQPVDQSAG